MGQLRSAPAPTMLKPRRDIEYLPLAAFTAEFSNPSFHVRKFRVWTLRQFYHVLSLHGYAQNVAKRLYTSQDRKDGTSLPYSERIQPADLSLQLQSRRHSGTQKSGPHLAARHSRAEDLRLVSLQYHRPQSFLRSDPAPGKGPAHSQLILSQTLGKILDNYLKVRNLKQGPGLNRRSLQTSNLTQRFFNYLACIRSLVAERCLVSSELAINAATGRQPIE